MGDVSNWGAGHVGRILFGRSDTALAAYYLALITGNEPTSYGSGSELDEPVGMGYERVGISNTAANWEEQDYGRLVTKNVIAFPTATGEWGRVRHWALCTAVTGGQVVFYGKFANNKFVENGDTFNIVAGGIKIQLIAGEG